MKRIFFIRLNLDDLGHSLLGLSDQQKGEWLVAFQLGAAGRSSERASAHEIDGARIGSECAAEAQSRSDKLAKCGRMSAIVRKGSSGSAQPIARTRLEPGSNQARTRLEPGSNIAPNIAPNTAAPSTIYNPESTNDKPSPKSEDLKNIKKTFSPPSEDDVQLYCNERKNYIDAKRFISYYESRGWLIGRFPMKCWKAAVRTWERDREHPAQQNKHPSPPPLPLAQQEIFRADFQQKNIQQIDECQP